jgi:hypothetical protein
VPPLLIDFHQALVYPYLLVYGGRTSEKSKSKTDIYGFHLEQRMWFKLFNMQGPKPIVNPILLPVPSKDEVILFGGHSADKNTINADIWSLDLKLVPKKL